MDQKTPENKTQSNPTHETNNRQPPPPNKMQLNQPERTPTPFVSGHQLVGDESDDEHSSNNNEDDKLKIFIGGLTGETVDDDLLDYFSQYGTVLDTQIVLNSKTNTPNGFGFVTMKRSDTQEDIFELSHNINGNNVKL